MFKVFQIQLTNSEVDAINTIGWDATPRTQAYADRSFDSTFKVENFKFYDHVANVDAADLEDAFHLMNLWDDESKIERLDRCSSMSVGDIIEDADGRLFRCASFGFSAI